MTPQILRYSTSRGWAEKSCNTKPNKKKRKSKTTTTDSLYRLYPKYVQRRTAADENDSESAEMAENS